jgi:hypothetical protein
MIECQSSHTEIVNIWFIFHIFCTDATPIQQCTTLAGEDVVVVAMVEPVEETYETYPVEISWALDGSIVFLLQEN